MMTVRYAFTRPDDGGLSIFVGAPIEQLAASIGQPDGKGGFVLGRAAYEKHVRDKAIEEARKRGCAPSDVVRLPDDWTPPDDRTFRNAWTHSADSTRVDMARAREIWRGKMRRARAPLLAALDVDQLRAIEAKDEERAVEIVTRKQALRDVTDHAGIEAAATPDELKAVWPRELGTKPA